MIRRGGFQKCLGALKSCKELVKFECCIKIAFFNVWIRYFVWNFKGAH